MSYEGKSVTIRSSLLRVSRIGRQILSGLRSGYDSVFAQRSEADPSQDAGGDGHGSASEQVRAYLRSVGSPRWVASQRRLGRGLRRRLARLEVVGPDTAPVDLGWVPFLAVASAVGLLLVVAADATSRSMVSSSQTVFWIGLIAIYAPIVLRLLSSDARRNERIALVLLLGLSLYLVKVVHDPFGFTFSDELAHVPNVNAILTTHKLFHSNSILSVTPYYPGLETITSALASMTGLSAFGAGVIVIGVARVIMVLALFLLFERISGSARLASIGVAIYAANANFVFFSAQFSYESLALPLLVVTLMAVAEWRRGTSRVSWMTTIALLTSTIVVTHHISSYALTVFLLALCFAYDFRRNRGSHAPWGFALLALAMTSLWLILVASETVGYLSPVLTRAFSSTLHTVSGEAAPRHLFASAATGQQPSAIERGVGIGSVLLMAAGFPFGLLRVWRQYRHDPFAVLFAAAAAGVFATFVLRFAPLAWESANRASEFLFLGLGFVLALVGLERWSPSALPRLGTALAVAGLTIVFLGGVISGWTPSVRLSQPYRVEASSRVIDSEGRALAAWTNAHLGPRARFAASDADARLLASYGGEFAVAGHSPDVVDVLQTAALPSWELSLLSVNRLPYVVIDRRLRSFDNASGYFFGFRPGAGRPDVLLDPSAVAKFDRIHADRIFDSGNIVVFHVRSGK
jgi:hypothetical protein